MTLILIIWYLTPTMTISACNRNLKLSRILSQYCVFPIWASHLLHSSPWGAGFRSAAAKRHTQASTSPFTFRCCQAHHREPTLGLYGLGWGASVSPAPWGPRLRMSEVQGQEHMVRTGRDPRRPALASTLSSPRMTLSPACVPGISSEASTRHVHTPLLRPGQALSWAQGDAAPLEHPPHPGHRPSSQRVLPYPPRMLFLWPGPVFPEKKD